MQFSGHELTKKRTLECLTEPDRAHLRSTNVTGKKIACHTDKSGASPSQYWHLFYEHNLRSLNILECHLIPFVSITELECLDVLFLGDQAGEYATRRINCA